MSTRYYDPDLAPEHHDLGYQTRLSWLTKKTRLWEQCGLSLYSYRFAKAVLLSPWLNVKHSFVLFTLSTPKCCLKQCSSIPVLHFSKCPQPGDLPGCEYTIVSLVKAEDQNRFPHHFKHFELWQRNRGLGLGTPPIFNIHLVQDCSFLHHPISHPVPCHLVPPTVIPVTTASNNFQINCLLSLVWFTQFFYW